MCSVLALVDNKGFILSSDLWYACIMLPSGRINCGPFCYFFLNTERVHFDVVLCRTCVYNSIRRVIGGWVPSTVFTFVSVLC